MTDPTPQHLPQTPEEQAQLEAYCAGFDDGLAYAADLAEQADQDDLADQLRQEAGAAWMPGDDA
jgi:hypothetical protein